jgi:hypothetical protein
MAMANSSVTDFSQLQISSNNIKHPLIWDFPSQPSLMTPLRVPRGPSSRLPERDGTMSSEAQEEATGQQQRGADGEKAQRLALH